MTRKKTEYLISSLFTFFLICGFFTSVGRNFLSHPWASIFDETGRIVGYGAEPGNPAYVLANPVGGQGKIGVEIIFCVRVQTDNGKLINVVIPMEDYSKETPGPIGKSVFVEKMNGNFVLGPYHFDEPLINLIGKS